MDALVVALSLLVGLTLGLLGGGGSMLLLPLLVYLAGLPAPIAVVVSLFVVGTTSLLVLYPHARAGHVRWSTGLLFGVAGVAGSVMGSRFGALLPDWLLLSGFGVLLLGAAAPMLRPRAGRRLRPSLPRPPRELTPRLLLVSLSLGFSVGAIAGLVGAGGGFLIVPALIAIAGLTMKDAIGTSLFVITLHSGAGFVTHAAASPTSIPWPLLILVTSASVVGSWGGAALSKRLSPRRLELAFGVVLALVGALVLLESLGGLAWLTRWGRPLSGGALVGGAAALLWVTRRRVAGVSGIVGGLVGGAPDMGWRWAFSAGLVLAGLPLGVLYPSAFAASPVSLGATLAAGVLVGAGTTWGRGCTSGHGVCGVSRLSPRSLVATGSFVSVGMFVVYLGRHVFVSGSP